MSYLLVLDARAKKVKNWCAVWLTIFSPPRQEDGTSFFHQRPLPASEDVTSDEERMVICEEEGDDDVMGELNGIVWVVLRWLARLLHNHGVIISASQTDHVLKKKREKLSAEHLKVKKNGELNHLALTLNCRLLDIYIHKEEWRFVCI